MHKTFSSLLDQLNDPQRLAVTQTEGPMLILAGAGSGKTRTITTKVAYLIEAGLADPDRILAVTFTNKAAEEMRHRALGLTAHAPSSPVVCTFHSFGARTLRRYAERLGYSRDFTICDADDQKKVYRRVFQSLGLSTAELPIARIQSLVSRAKNDEDDPEAYLESHFRSKDWPLIPVFRLYQDLLRRSNAVDFDDLILLTGRLLEEHPDIREYLGSWYRYLLIDEFQDTNVPQYRLVRLLTSTHSNVSAVGDEDQSIYRFRGAEIQNILRFEEDYPGTRVVKLEENYRSTQVILSAATGVVSHNQQRKGKELWTRKLGGDSVEVFAAEDAKSEADFVCQRIYQFHELGDPSIAVLYRTNFQSRQFEETLRRLDIPYRLLGGVSFYSRKEVRDALAYLKVSRNAEDDVSLMRIINEPARGIGSKTILALQSDAQEHGTSIWKTLLASLEQGLLPGRTHSALSRFRDLVLACSDHLEEHPLHLAFEKILDASGYLEHWESQETEEAEDRIANLKELITVARDYQDREHALQEFLDEAALYSETDDYDPDAGVTLMTIHNAKGLEFRTVFIVGCEEGLFPHMRSISEEDIEEERRLCYVGMTRAQQRLFMTYCRKRRFYGRESEGRNEPSRFLKEIPDHLVRESYSRAAPSTPSFHSGLRRRESRPFAGKTYNSLESVNDFLSQLSKKRPVAGGFAKGSLVEHDKFGRGRVLQVREEQGDLKITVQFPDGIRNLMQRFAKLRVL